MSKKHKVTTSTSTSTSAPTPTWMGDRSSVLPGVHLYAAPMEERWPLPPSTAPNPYPLPHPAVTTTLTLRPTHDEQFKQINERLTRLEQLLGQICERLAVREAMEELLKRLGEQGAEKKG